MDELTYINNRIRDYMNQLADHMAGGGCHSFDEYQNCCGQVQAFALIEREIIDLREKLEKAQ
jgi:hypothetical protein